ncbi:unnamed protein product [Ixodes pacificus]
MKVHSSLLHSKTLLGLQLRFMAIIKLAGFTTQQQRWPYWRYTAKLSQWANQEHCPRPHMAETKCYKFLGLI